ncbi:MAG: hypothetical protein NTU81_00480 [Candidatus Nomurabacteria bacterium]|nr:hypothetical protein [Candidatus Nomurabacteria bacterium]
MNKNFLLIIFSFLFVGFVAYATIKTNTTESEYFADQEVASTENTDTLPLPKIIQSDILSNLNTKDETVTDIPIVNSVVEKETTPIVTLPTIKKVVKKITTHKKDRGIDEYDD